jgi:Deacetylases, including yeast histone deacetylase and acetoin utilization protein
MNRRQFLRLSCGLALAMTQISTVLAKVRQPPTNQTGFVYDSIYLEHILEPGHPESPERLQGIMAAMERSGLLNQVLLLEPLTEVMPHIYQIHTREHVQSIQTHYGRSHDVAAAAVGGRWRRFRRFVRRGSGMHSARSDRQGITPGIPGAKRDSVCTIRSRWQRAMRSGCFI